MATFDTVIIHDARQDRTFIGATRAEALEQLTTVGITEHDSGGWRVRVPVPGYVHEIVLSYSAQFTRDEVIAEAARDALRLLARDYSRYLVYLATRQ